MLQTQPESGCMFLGLGGTLIAIAILLVLVASYGFFNIAVAVVLALVLLTAGVLLCYYSWAVGVTRRGSFS